MVTGLPRQDIFQFCERRKRLTRDAIAFFGYFLEVRASTLGRGCVGPGCLAESDDAARVSFEQLTERPFLACLPHNRLPTIAPAKSPAQTDRAPKTTTASSATDPRSMFTHPRSTAKSNVQRPALSMISNPRFLICHYTTGSLGGWQAE